jgi:hypothetical protein
MALERTLAGLSTRCYPVGLEPVGARTAQAATSTSRSAVSRRFVAGTDSAQHVRDAGTTVHGRRRRQPELQPVVDMAGLMRRR